MRPGDFFQSWVEFPGDGDPLRAVTQHSFDTSLVRQLRRGPLPGHDDLDAVSGLARLVHDELEHYGSDGGHELHEDDIREALLALRALLTGSASPDSIHPSGTTERSGATG